MRIILSASLTEILERIGQGHKVSKLEILNILNITQKMIKGLSNATGIIYLPRPILQKLLERVLIQSI